MFLPRIPLISAATTAILAITVSAGGVVATASAAPVEIVREYREVPGAGVFTTCADGTDVTFTSLSYRDYTTWLLDGVAVREHRHLTFDGTLTRGTQSLGYTGVWNRDQDFVTGEHPDHRRSVPRGPAFRRNLGGGGLPHRRQLSSRAPTTAS